jgi:hypothetical protein
MGNRKCRFLKLEVAHTESRETIVRKCCNTKVSRTVIRRFSIAGRAAIFIPEAGVSMFLRNVGIYIVSTLHRSLQQHGHLQHFHNLTFVLCDD